MAPVHIALLGRPSPMHNLLTANAAGCKQEQHASQPDSRGGRSYPVASDRAQQGRVRGHNTHSACGLRRGGGGQLAALVTHARARLPACMESESQPYKRTQASLGPLCGAPRGVGTGFVPPHFRAWRPVPAARSVTRPASGALTAQCGPYCRNSPQKSPSLILPAAHSGLLPGGEPWQESPSPIPFPGRMNPVPTFD